MPTYYPGFIGPHDTEATARNLEEGEEYDFRVMAVNENGESEPLVTSAGIIAKHPFGELLYIEHSAFHKYITFIRCM